MIYGNTLAASNLAAYIDTYLTRNHTFSFVILAGPTHVGKTAHLDQILTEKLWTSKEDILLPLFDHGKRLPISVDKAKQSYEIDGQQYMHLWVREIQEWAFISSLSKHKILYIENIDRITIQAANAFLKILEEAPRDLLVVASTNNLNTLLPTMQSRWMIFRFNLVDDESVYSFINTTFPQQNDEEKQGYLTFAQGKPWRLSSLQAKWILDDVIETCSIYASTHGKPWTYLDLKQRLNQLEEEWLLKDFFIVLQSYYLEHGQQDAYDRILKLNKYYDRWVSLENVLHWLVFA